MKTSIKIIIACILIFGLSIYATKKSIDHTFKQTECSQVNTDSPLDYTTFSEEV